MKKKIIIISLIAVTIVVSVITCVTFIVNKSNEDYRIECQEKALEVVNCLIEYSKFNSDLNRDIVAEKINEFTKMYEKSALYEEEKRSVLYSADLRIRHSGEFVLLEIDGWIDAFTILSQDYNSLEGYVLLYTVV